MNYKNNKKIIYGVSLYAILNCISSQLRET